MIKMNDYGEKEPPYSVSFHLINKENKFWGLIVTGTIPLPALMNAWERLNELNDGSFDPLKK